MFYLSAQTSIIREGPNRDFYLKKRGEGRKHVQAIIALARRRVSVLWALLRDGRIFTTNLPAAENGLTPSLRLPGAEGRERFHRK